MINIYKADTDIIAIEYCDKIRNWLNHSTHKVPDTFRKSKDRNKNRFEKMIRYVYDRIMDDKVNLIISRPENFNDFIKDFNDIFQQELDTYEKAKKWKKANTSFGKFKRTMGALYSTFFNDPACSLSTQDSTNGYWLMRKLNIKVCPYCNRNYTIAVDGDTKTRPEFDHNIPKSDKPILALSFFNLIPACPTCNHLKSSKEIIFNPYIVNCDDIKFIPDLTVTGHEEDTPKKIISAINKITEVENIKLKIKTQNENQENFIKKLAIDKLYNEHLDYVTEILEKAIAYNHSYYDGLVENFRDLGIDISEIDKLIWGTYTQIDNLGNSPLSKLTRDILEFYDIY